MKGHHPGKLMVNRTCSINIFITIVDTVIYDLKAIAMTMHTIVTPAAMYS